MVEFTLALTCDDLRFASISGNLQETAFLLSKDDVVIGSPTCAERWTGSLT